MPTFLTNLKYPFLTYTLVGFVLGVAAMSLTLWGKYAEVEEKRQMISTLQQELKTTTEKLMAEVQKVTREKESLQQQISKKKVTKPDGTIVEEENTNTSKDTETYTEVNLKVARILISQEQTYKAVEEIRTTLLERHKITIGLGVDQELDMYVHGHAGLWGPIGIGAALSRDTYIGLFTVSW